MAGMKIHSLCVLAYLCPETKSESIRKASGGVVKDATVVEEKKKKEEPPKNAH